MDRDFSSPNFDAARPRSNSTSSVPYYFFSATSSCGRRDADPIMSQLPPLHPIATTREVPNFTLPEHAVPSPTTECESPRRDDAIEAALSQMSDALASLASYPAAFASLGSALCRQNDSTSRDAVPQPVPIPTQNSFLVPAVPVDNAVANAPDQRLAQPLPLATSAAANPLPRYCQRVLSGILTTATCFSSQRIALGSRNHPASAFVHS